MRDVKGPITVGDKAKIGARVGDDVIIMVFGGGFVINAQERGPDQHENVLILDQRGNTRECPCPCVGHDKFRLRGGMRDSGLSG